MTETEYSLLTVHHSLKGTSQGFYLAVQVRDAIIIYYIELFVVFTKFFAKLNCPILKRLCGVFGVERRNQHHASGDVDSNRIVRCAILTQCRVYFRRRHDFILVLT